MSKFNFKHLCFLSLVGVVFSGCLFEEDDSNDTVVSSSIEASSSIATSSDLLSSQEVSSTSLSSQALSSSIQVSSSAITFNPDTVQSFLDSLKTNIDSTAWINSDLDIQVSTWKSFAKSAYSLTFDDGYSSAYYHLFPLLEKHGLKATFYIITNPINRESNEPTGTRATWTQLQEMFAEGHEIGAHSISHPNLTTLELGDENTPGTLIYEVAQSYKDLVDSIPGNIPYTFAYPYTTSNGILRAYTEKYFISARAMGPAHASNFEDWYSLGGYLQEYGNINTRTLANDQKIGQNMADYIQKSVISKNKWGILLAHEVVPFDSLSTHNSWHPHSNESMDIFLSHLKKQQDSNNVWVATMEDVTKYSQSRNQAQLGVLQQTPELIEFSIEDGLSDEVYDIPLSLSISLDSSWKKVLVTQGSKSEELNTLNNSLKFNALANGSNISLAKIP